MNRAAILLALCLSAYPAHALTSAQLGEVKIDVPPNAALPLALPFTDETGAPRTLGETMAGKPTILIFADYTCSNLCGPILSFAADALDKSGLTPSRDFRLVVIGLDPKDSLTDARAIKQARIGNGTALAAATTFLLGKHAAVQAATAAAGFTYVYDSEHDQFAHSAAAFVLARDGRIVRVLSGLGLSGDDLRLALIDAGQGRVGSLVDQLRLHCFGFDPARGVYTASISTMLAISGGATALVLAGGLLLLTFKARRV